MQIFHNVIKKQYNNGKNKHKIINLKVMMKQDKLQKAV